MSKFKFSYDEDNDDLFLFNPLFKSRGSVEFGSLILDYNSKKEFVGLQINCASSFIRDVLGEKTDLGAIKKVLANLKECQVLSKLRNNLLTINICLTSGIKEIRPITFTVPSIRETSPALAEA